MGLYGSIWSHTLQIRSHMGYKGSGMAKMGLGCRMIMHHDMHMKSFQNNLDNEHAPEAGPGVQDHS